MRDITILKPMPPQKRHLFQVNHHVQASIMLLSIMDGAELELNNTLLPSSSTATPKTIISANATATNSTSEDYEKGFFFSSSSRSLSLIDFDDLDLQLAAELGRCLLERNQEFQAYIGVLQKQIEDQQNDIKV